MSLPDITGKVRLDLNRFPIKIKKILFWAQHDKFGCLFVYLFILGRKLNRQNCLLKEVLREREEKEEKEKKKSN